MAGRAGCPLPRPGRQLEHAGEASHRAASLAEPSGAGVLQGDLGNSRARRPEQRSYSGVDASTTKAPEATPRGVRDLSAPRADIARRALTEPPVGTEQLTSAISALCPQSPIAPVSLVLRFV